MALIKSGCTHFRKALKIKGSTEHSGRGFYMLKYDCSPDELIERIEALVEKNSEKYIVSRDDNGGIHVKIKSELTEQQYYNTLNFNATISHPWLTVSM